MAIKINSEEYQMPDYLRDLVFGSYTESEKYLHGKDSLTRDISLTKELLNKLNISFSKWPTVTVTGSKGKGSTSVLISSILASSGEKVGLITSPELRRFNERIRINGKCVSDEDLEQAAEEIGPIVKSVIAGIKPPKYLGPGGVVLALAAKIFAKNEVTVAVIEAGRGGEYDESRLVEANVSVITPIMLKHAENIGPTIEDIARTKTYITAPKATIICAPQNPSIKRVIAQIAKKLSSPVLSVGKDIQIYNLNSDINSTACDLRVNGDEYRNLKISLAGSYQAENTAAAVLATRTLRQFGAKCTTEGIYKGVAQVRWPGRCQVLKKNPFIFLDGAINKISAKSVTEILKSLPIKKFTAVVAIHRGEDLEGVCSEISKIAYELILTEVHTTNLKWSRDSLLKSGSKYFKNIKYIPDANEAFELVENSAKKDEGILLFGHQSFVGAALRYWNVDTCKLW